MKDPKVHFQNLFDSGQYAQVIEQTDASLFKVDTPMDVLDIRARAMQRLERFEEAMGIWNVLISKNKLNAYYFGERGVCKFQLRYKSAMDDLNEAIRLEPDNAYHYSCRAYMKDKLGDTEGSIEDYSLSLELDPENEVTLNNLGLAEEKLGYTKNAREHMKKADALAALSKGLVQEEIIPLDKGNIWKEVGKMITSRKEFRKFLHELFSK
jgi:tetratricopeptide (TPR) repeat protein